MSTLPTLTIIYASASGNVEAVVEKVAAELKSDFAISLHKAEVTPFTAVTSHKLFIFATSTWEHGEINPFFSNILKEMGDADLEGKRAGFVGLGDKRYEPVLYCEGMEKLRRAWKAGGGEETGEALRINGEPYELLETVVAAWAVTFREALQAKS